MQWLTVPTPRRPPETDSRTSSAPRHFGRCPGTVKYSHTCGRRAAMSNSITCAACVARNQVPAPVLFLVPRLFEIAHPALQLADDVDRLFVRDEPLRRRIDIHRPDAGIRKQHVGVVAQALLDRILQQPMHQNHVAAGEFIAAGHSLLDEFAMMDDELEIELAACRGTPCTCRTSPARCCAIACGT